MELKNKLTSRAPDDWVVDQVIVFDWYDGPRQGVACLTQPPCEFYFELLAERYNPNGLDDRLFRVSELPPGSVAKVLEATQALGSPTNAVWVPTWKFSSEGERRQADQAINQILSARKDTGIVIASPDMATFLGCWQTDGDSHPITDWFSALGVS